MRRKLLSTAVILICTCAPCQSQSPAPAPVCYATTAPESPLQPPEVLLQGRFKPGANLDGKAFLPQAFSWAGSSIYASFEGATIVQLDIVAARNAHKYAVNWLRVYIDGRTARDIFTSNSQPISLAINTTAANHTLRITKLSDAQDGSATLQSMSLDAGRFLPPNMPASLGSQRKILSLGASFTVGHANVGNLEPNTCAPLNTTVPEEWRKACANIPILDVPCSQYVSLMAGNAQECWSSKLPLAFNADFQIIGSSGNVLAGSGNTTNVATFKQMIYGDTDLNYNLSAWVPQVVLIGSSANDWFYQGDSPPYTVSEWTMKAIQLVDEIGAHYPQAKIVIIAWPSMQMYTLYGSDPAATNRTAYYSEAMHNLYNVAREQGRQNVYYVPLNTTGYDNMTTWCARHPDAKTDYAITKQLADFILSDVMPSWSLANPLPTVVNETLALPALGHYAR